MTDTQYDFELAPPDFLVVDLKNAGFRAVWGTCTVADGVMKLMFTLHDDGECQLDIVVQIEEGNARSPTNVEVAESFKLLPLVKNWDEAPGIFKTDRRFRGRLTENSSTYNFVERSYKGEGCVIPSDMRNVRMWVAVTPRGLLRALECEKKFDEGYVWVITGEIFITNDESRALTEDEMNEVLKLRPSVKYWTEGPRLTPTSRVFHEVKQEAS